MLGEDLESGAYGCIPEGRLVSLARTNFEREGLTQQSRPPQYILLERCGRDLLRKFVRNEHSEKRAKERTQPMTDFVRRSLALEQRQCPSRQRAGKTVRDCSSESIHQARN